MRSNSGHTIFVLLSFVIKKKKKLFLAIDGRRRYIKKILGKPVIPLIDIRYIKGLNLGFVTGYSET